jgi:hypothetical protein
MHKFRWYLPAAVIFLLCSVIFLSGCDAITGAEPQGEGFAIYLTRDNIPPSDLAIVSHIDIADTPIISADDIVYYDRDRHEIALTTEAFQRIQDMKVPTSGTSFAVCVNKSPVYAGAFWAWYSSQSFDGIVIMTPLTMEKGAVIRIELGYVQDYSGADPRGNESIRQASKPPGN